jgi:MFS family permease
MSVFLGYVMSIAVSQSSSKRQSVVLALLPIMSVVFMAFFITGLTMPVLPLHVHQGLGLSTFVVGMIAGTQFAAALISRFWSGRSADMHGSKRAVIIGLVIAALAGLFYHVSLAFADSPATSGMVLLIARAIFGAAESFIITGALSWGLVLGGPKNTGKVMAWVGMAMYVAFAIGAPVGTTLYSSYGFTAIALATTLIPLATLFIIGPLRSIAPTSHARPAYSQVIKAIWVPGVGLAFSSIGFGAITTFITLLFVNRGWNAAWLAFTGFSLAFVVARVVLGHLADKIGGAKVALVSVLIEAAGLALIWLAPDAALAISGAVLTGFGYSLVYPGFGVEAVSRAPAQNRGLAMGAYTAFLDLSLGITSPALGLIADKAAITSVFLVSTLAVLSGAGVAIQLLYASSLRASA